MALTLQDYHYEFSPASGYFDQYQEGAENDPLVEIMRESEKDQTTRNLAIIAGVSIVLITVLVAIIIRKKKK